MSLDAPGEFETDGPTDVGFLLAKEVTVRVGRLEITSAPGSGPLPRITVTVDGQPLRKVRYLTLDLGVDQLPTATVEFLV